MTNKKDVKPTTLKDKVFTHTKAITTWAMAITTIYLAISEYGIYVLHTQPSGSITDLIQVLIVGVIIGYMGKSGFEFYQRNKTELASLSCDASQQNTENEGEIK
jgi:hypothetical protein